MTSLKLRFKSRPRVSYDNGDKNNINTFNGSQIRKLLLKLKLLRKSPTNKLKIQEFLKYVGKFEITYRLLGQRGLLSMLAVSTAIHFRSCDIRKKKVSLKFVLCKIVPWGSDWQIDIIPKRRKRLWIVLIFILNGDWKPCQVKTLRRKTSVMFDACCS